MLILHTLQCFVNAHAYSKSLYCMLNKIQWCVFLIYIDSVYMCILVVKILVNMFLHGEKFQLKDIFMLESPKYHLCQDTFLIDALQQNRQGFWKWWFFPHKEGYAIFCILMTTNVKIRIYFIIIWQVGRKLKFNMSALVPSLCVCICVCLSVLFFIQCVYWACACVYECAYFISAVHSK